MKSMYYVPLFEVLTGYLLPVDWKVNAISWKEICVQKQRSKS